ncbi:50S ribosomal protein L34e [archaeon]|nr:50S ribosomal protein L34e [archaeon]
MVAPRLRSRSLRRIQRRVPGGRTVMHFKKRKPNIAKCAHCKKPLAGVPRLRPYKMKNLQKTKKRPERKYGGILCSACTRRKIMQEAGL